MRRLKAMTMLTMLICIFFTVATVCYAADDDIFSQDYSSSADMTGKYLGSICTVDSTTNQVTLPSSIQDICEKYKSTSSQHSITIKSGTATPKIVNLTKEGYEQLVAMGKQVYDKQSIRNKVQGIGQDFDVKADTEQAGIMLSGIRPVVSLIVGLLAYAVVIGMSLFTALDIVYITMPVFRNKCEEMKQSGNGALVKTDKNGETKLRWVTDEAQYAVTQCTIETGKNPLGVYFKKRVVAYLLIAIVIYILLTGNIDIIVNVAINFVSGIMDALATLGK